MPLVGDPLCKLCHVIDEALLATYTEFIWSGRVRGKVSFSLRSGKVKETWNDQGKNNTFVLYRARAGP